MFREVIEVDLMQEETTQVAAWTVYVPRGAMRRAAAWRFVLRSDGYLFGRCKWIAGKRNKYPQFRLESPGRWGHPCKVEAELVREGLTFKRHPGRDGKPFVGVDDYGYVEEVVIADPATQETHRLVVGQRAPRG